MAAITNLSDLVNRMTGGNSGTPETIWWHKAQRIAGGAGTSPIVGRPYSLWLLDGQPSGGVAPTTVATPDNTTTGGLKQTDPGGGREKWLTDFSAVGNSVGMLMLYDRLLHIGGFDGTSTGAQTVGGSLARYTNGIGNLVWAEIYTAIGNTPTTITMSYTDDGGNSGQTSQAVAIGGANNAERCRSIFLPLASGDKGVQAVASVTLAGSTGTVGDFGVTIAHPLASVSLGAGGIAGWRNFVTGQPGLPEIETDACLALMWFPATTTIPELYGALSTVEA